MLESFEKYLAKTDLHQQFGGIAEVPASRTLKHQLRMVHKESGIHVFLLVDDVAVTDVPKVIRDFLAIKPICKEILLQLHFSSMNCSKMLLMHLFFSIQRSTIDWICRGMAKCSAEHFGRKWSVYVQIQYVYDIHFGDIFHASEL